MLLNLSVSSRGSATRLSRLSTRSHLAQLRSLLPSLTSLRRALACPAARGLGGCTLSWELCPGCQRTGLSAGRTQSQAPAGRAVTSSETHLSGWEAAGALPHQPPLRPRPRRPRSPALPSPLSAGAGTAAARDLPLGRGRDRDPPRRGSPRQLTARRCDRAFKPPAVAAATPPPRGVPRDGCRGAAGLSPPRPVRRLRRVPLGRPFPRQGRPGALLCPPRPGPHPKGFPAGAGGPRPRPRGSLASYVAALVPLKIFSAVIQGPGIPGSSPRLLQRIYPSLFLL